MQGPETHLHTWSDVAAPIVATSIDDLVGDASACIDDEEVGIGLQRTGANDGCQTVAAKRLGRAITTRYGYRGVRHKAEQRERQTIECFLLAWSEIADGTHDALTKAVLTDEGSQSREVSILSPKLIHGLVSTESHHLDDGVSYVYYQFHGHKGTTFNS